MVMLWHASRLGSLVGYDEWDAWIVAAETEEEAAAMTGYDHERGFTIELIGEALPDALSGIVLGSFNAG